MVGGHGEAAFGEEEVKVKGLRLFSNPILRPAGLAKNPGPEACFVKKARIATFLVTTPQTEKSLRQRSFRHGGYEIRSPL